MQNTPVTTVLLSCAALGLACGSPAPAKGAANTAADAGSATSTTSVDDAGAAPKPNAVTTAADAGAPAGDLLATTTKSDTHVVDADDACQSVAAAFEKRARPQLKACYREGKKKDANLVGGVRLAVGVTDAGKLGAVLTSPNGDKIMLPPAVVKCMVDAVKTTDAGDVTKCKGKSIAIPVQFPSE